MTEYAFEGPKRSSATVTWSFATQNYPADVASPYSSPIDPIYQATIEATINRWSAVSGLSFTEVPDSPTAAIRIGFGVFYSPYEIGETIVHSVGGYLPNDTVIRLLDPSADPLTQDAQGVWSYSGIDLTLYQVTLHELGHALGLAHTTDPTTIMYPVASTTNTDLAAGDLEGINVLYPLYTVTALDPVQVQPNSGSDVYHFVVTRHDDLGNGDTINFQVVGAPYPGFGGTVAASGAAFLRDAYPSGQISFAPGVGSVALSVAVAGGATLPHDRGFAVSLGSADPGKTLTERGTSNAAILGDGAEAALGGPILPVYRFFDTVDGTHFFTDDQAERNILVQTRSDLTYEGAPLDAVADPGTDPNAVAVFRFFDTGSGTHFFTANATERDSVASSRADLVSEGIGFYEHATQQSGDTAVYRFFDSQSGTHFLTSDTAERAAILATQPNYVDEGVAFYAPASA